jgi:hypothetical protein
MAARFDESARVGVVLFVARHHGSGEARSQGVAVVAAVGQRI